MKLNHIAIFLLFSGLLLSIQGCGTENNVVTVYTSVDRDYSEPILNDFSEQNPEITLNAVYDSELTKTTGLFNRLLEEKENPQADVFWNSEIIRTIQLEEEGVLQPYQSPMANDIPAKYKDEEGYWTGFSVRARVMAINTDLVPDSETPTQIPDLAAPKYLGKTAMAIPFFGTTSAHMALFYHIRGRELFSFDINRIKANGAKFLTGNATVRDQVANGTIAYGLTDTDDVFAALDEDKPIRMVYVEHHPNKGILVIPNTVGLIANAPNAELGKTLIDYLLSQEVEEKLAFSRAHQIPVRDTVPRPEQVPQLSELKTVEATFDEIAEDIKPCLELLRQLLPNL